MLSAKAHHRLKLFLDTFEEETGYRPENVQLWAYNGDRELAKDLSTEFSMEWSDFDSHSSVKKLYSLDDSTQMQIYYTFAPEELEEEPPKCDVCEKELTEEEQLSPFLESMCVHCTKEQQNELIQQNKDYRHSVI